MESFEKIFREYAYKLKVPYERLSFSFDGARLEVSETPDSVDMEDDECIDVIGL